MIEYTPILATHAGLFAGPQPELAFASIVAGNTVGRFWQIDTPTGLAALLWDKGNNVVYLAGAVASVQTELQQLVQATIRPQAIQEGRIYFKVSSLSDTAQSVVPSLFSGIKLRPLEKRLYRLAVAPDVADWPSPEGVQIAPIDQSFLQRIDLAGIEDIREEVAVMWRLPELFIQYGLGFAALFGSRMICWCTSEYMSADRCGIGIATNPAFERRGIATATAARMVQACLRRGLTPYWECRSDNKASIRVAEKLGFTLIETETVQIGQF